MNSGDHGLDSSTLQRQRWMAILAKADPIDLEQYLTSLDAIPDYSLLRGPDIGLVMVQGRMGGTGHPFNVGEMPMSHCVVQLDSIGSSIEESPQSKVVHGFGYIAGRSLHHAQLAAIVDGLLQLPDWHRQVWDKVIQPLATIAEAKRVQQRQQTDATQVNFFTLQRGQD